MSGSATLQARPKPRPFRLTAFDAGEDCLHEAVANALDILLLPPTQWTTMPAGGYELTAAAAARLVRLGLKASWPDVQIVHEGRFHGIELKTRTGRLSRTRQVPTRWGGTREIVGQVERHAMLEAAGARVAVCRTVDDVLAQLAAWGIPTRIHHQNGGST